MPPHVVVWDLETVPDIKGFAAANGHDGKTDEEIRAAIGDKFPKHLYHSIVCIGTLIAHRDTDQWVVDALGAPHVGERSEKELITSFVGRIAELNPQLVTFNGTAFDLPVLRYRAMTHGVAAPGLAARPYFHRYTDDAVDLCDVLSSFSSQAKATLHELCRVMGLPGKPDGISGAEVEKYFRDGHIQEIADYCESDVINTYRLWLRYELFRGRLAPISFETSEQNLIEFTSQKKSVSNSQTAQIIPGTQAEKLTRNVEEYCKRYRHPLLENFKVHSHHLESWWHTDVSSRCGCYAIYTESGELLYIGKASNSASVGSRLAAHLRHVDPAWMPAPAFVQIVEVCEPFEAPSLEEYLIRELQPRFNDRGINRRPTREPSNETPFPLKS